MDNPRIIHAPIVNGRRYAITSPITQYDYGYLLLPEGTELPATYEIDFSNDEKNGTSLTVYGGSEGAEVPEELIRTGKDVYAFYYHVDDGYGKTEFTWRIPNKCRPSRDGQTPTPSQQSSIDQLIVRSNEAVTSAEQSASAAGQSAQSASEDAGRAEQARTGAETAQRKAEEAQESAERAKDDAETSERNASESERQAKGYAETASAKADAITGLTAQATTLPDGSSATASYDAETGVVSFGIPKGKDGTDGDDGYSPTADVSKTGKVVTITITDKNGTTSAQVSDGEDGATGATPNLTIGTVETLEPSESATATITGTPENPVLNLGIPQGEQGEVTTEEFLKAFVTDSASGSIASFPDGADGIPLKSLVVDIDPVQDLSHGDPSPENICPISGWEGMTVNASGKNLLDPSLLKDQPAWNTIKFYAPVGTTLTMSTNNTDVLTATGLLTYLRRPGQSQGTGNLVSASNPVTRVVGSDGYVEIVQRNPSNTISYADFQWQLEIGSTATAYEPYTGRSIPISWQSEAGTVYGGKLDVLTGKLTVYPYYASYNGETLTGEWISDRDVYAEGTTPTIGAQVVNIGAEGTEYQLEPHEIASLLGANNIFADTGDTYAEYRANTKLYIEKLTQPEEDDMVADSAINSGQFFMIGNALYRALTNIASGATITVGTNAQRVSLSDALNLVNS